MRFLLKIFLIVSAFFWVERFCHKATDGFAMVNVYPPQGNHQMWERIEPLDPQLISSPYRYFSSGSQSYVFISEDNQTVLKLFKFQHMRIPPWLEYLPSFPYLEAKREKKRQVLEKTFSSISLAYDFFREETALLYIHLAPTDHLHTQVTLIDKIGKKHVIHLDQIPFLIQRKGTLAYQAIDEWMEKGEIEKAKQGIKNLLHLALQRCQQGIFDKDPDFSTNFGFIGSAPFQIDFGRFVADETEKDPTIYQPEMIRITRHFHHYLEKNHPDLLHCFEEELLTLVE